MAAQKSQEPQEEEAKEPSRSCARRRFYFWQFVSCVTYWLVLRAKTGHHLYATTAGTVCTRPGWLPARALLALHKLRVPIFISAPALMGLAAVRSQSTTLRVMTAVVTSMYHLLESSVTNRHGEYPLLYNVWAMALPEQYAQAAAMGVAVHFVLASGVAKLQVAGRAWMQAQTMRTYLDIYWGSRSGPPLSKALNRWLARRAWATQAIGVGTIALECLVVPSALLMRPGWRHIATALMAALHLGIAVAMSGMVGLVFLTALPSYLVGFGCRAPVGSKPWLVAAAAALLPSLSMVLRRRPLAESWPLTPISLFMWSGEQADALRRSLMGDTRVVMSTAEAPTDISHLPVCYNGGPVDAAKLRGISVVHDALTRVIGFTLSHGELSAAVPSIREDTSTGTWEMTGFLRALQAWLVRERRVLELHSGHALVRAAFVRADQRGRVAEVLLDASTLNG